MWVSKRCQERRSIDEYFSLDGVGLWMLANIEVFSHATHFHLIRLGVKCSIVLIFKHISANDLTQWVLDCSVKGLQ
jgi:hypothetical protein